MSFQSCQRGRHLLEYYNELNSIFLELDYRRPNDMECTNGIEKLRKHTVEDRIYIFLTGLDHNLDQVSCQILASVFKGVIREHLKARSKARWYQKASRHFQKNAMCGRRTSSSLRRFKGAKAYAFFASGEEAYTSR